MDISRAGWRSMLTLGLCVIPFLACGVTGGEPDMENDSATGGESPTGGGSGGAVGSGGFTSSGGKTGSGGETSSGGFTSRGGAPPLPSTNLYFEGGKYALAAGDEWEILRSDPRLMPANNEFSLANSRTTASAGIVFETTSPTVIVHFRYDPAHQQRFSTFGVSQDGGSFATMNVPASDTSTVLNINSESPGSPVRYRIVLPPWANPILTSIDREPGHELIEFTPPTRGAYVALGDSITHGTGINASFEGYAWQTAEDLGLELFNLGSGGAKVSPTLASSLADWNSLSLVTVLFGYNDWMNQGKTKQEFKDAYDDMLGIIRVSHPTVPLVCLSILESNATVSGATGLPVTDFRDAISEVVTARQSNGDTNIYLAPSDTWTNKTTDVPDGIHPGTAGSVKLSDALTSFLQTEVGF